MTTHGSISRKNSERLNNGSTTIADPSVQRLMENCSRDLSHQYRNLHENERNSVKKVMTEKRARYCTFVQCLNPIINEEFGMLSEVCQIEDVMHKLMNITSTPGILPKSDEEVSLMWFKLIRFVVFREINIKENSDISLIMVHFRSLTMFNHIIWSPMDHYR